jgi:hypothetical protein
MRQIVNRHIRMCRTYGDSLAWRLLHPFSIRQLAKNPGQAPPLSNQQDAMGTVLEFVKESAAAGVAAIACDLTNILRIGDAIAIGDPERPQILEFKSRHIPERLRYQGRHGRQLSRMEGTAKYLHEGHARVHGEPWERVALETTTPKEYDWQPLAEAIEQARSAGIGTVDLSDYQTIMVIADADFDADPIVEKYQRRRFYFGAHTRALEECWETISPPFVWMLDPESRFQLMEGDLIALNFVDPEAFVGISSKHGEIIAADVDDETLESGCFRVRAGNQTIIASSNFLRLVLYGFHTISSVAHTVIEAAAISGPRVAQVVEDPTD